MPSSKRARVVPTSKTKKNRKELSRRLHTNIHAACDGYQYIWVFNVQNTRNTALKQIRTQLADSRIFMGKTKVMLHALGHTQEMEYLTGLSGLAGYMSGEVGLLFTDRDPQEIERILAEFSSLDFARAGAVAGHDFSIPKGQELRTQYGVEGGQDDLLPMNIEPTLRKLGVPTKLVKGKIVLEDGAGDGMEDDEDEGYVVCREGDVLDSRQTAILKIFGVRMAEFRVGLRAMFDKKEQSVTEVGGMDVEKSLE